MSLEVSPTAARARRRLLPGIAVFAILSSVAVGVFAANDWFPKTDPMSGKRLGWFGKSLASNAPSSWNPIAAVLPSPTPTPLPLSKEYLYAGSRLLSVEDANAVAAPPADIAVWRESNGLWCVMGQAGSAQSFESWGLQDDVPMPGDYDADGKTDIAIWRPSTGLWWIFYSSTSTYDSIAWGDDPQDIPVAADWDGDGKTDLGIARRNDVENQMEWYVLLSGGGNTGAIWGLDNDTPAVADYDGDGKADYAVYRSTTDEVYWVRSSDSQAQWIDLNNNGSDVVSSDYDGDGKADPAVYKKSTAYWYIYQSTTNTVVSTQWGTSGDLPVHNDYDGDGKTDLATFTPHATASIWTIRRSSNNTTRTEYWGITGDYPVPAFYRR